MIEYFTMRQTKSMSDDSKMFSRKKLNFAVTKAWFISLPIASLSNLASSLLLFLTRGHNRLIGKQNYVEPNFTIWKAWFLAISKNWLHRIFLNRPIYY